MMGHSHAVSGLAVGAALLPIAPVHGLTAQVAWMAVWAGSAMLPDFDQRGATIGRMWGWPTQAVATGIGAACRGHRNGTHDLILGPAAFAGIAYASTFHPWALLVVLAFTIGTALKACAFAIPGNTENTVLGNLALSWGGAWWLVHAGIGSPHWLPVAVGGGAVVHILGDALTVGGCPVPFTWFDGHATRYKLGLFRTGSGVERNVVAPALIAVAGGLLWFNSSLFDVTRGLVNAYHGN